MAPTSNRFKPFGPYGETFARHQLKQLKVAKDALGDGEVLDVNTVDFTYDTYKKDNAIANSDCIQAYPGPENDRARKTRENYNSSVTRFKKWYSSGDGKTLKQKSMSGYLHATPNLTISCLLLPSAVWASVCILVDRLPWSLCYNGRPEHL